MTEAREPEAVDLPAEVAAEMLRLFDATEPLAADTVPADAEKPDQVQAEAMRRGLLEAWAALPLALEPTSPSAATRERLLARVRGEGVAPPFHRAARRSRPWLLPLAATLVVALLGVSVGLWSRLGEQSRRIERLTQRVEELSAAPAATAVQARLDAMEQYLGVVSTPGVAVCPLRHMATQADSTSTRGLLYVAPDHQHWYLALSGLPPAPEGQSYHLWFFVDDRPVSAGAFAARAGEIVRLGSDEMPVGTHAVGITLEPREEMERPSSEPILFGDEMLQVT